MVEPSRDEFLIGVVPLGNLQNHAWAALKEYRSDRRQRPGVKRWRGAINTPWQVAGRYLRKHTEPESIPVEEKLVILHGNQVALELAIKVVVEDLWAATVEGSSDIRAKVKPWRGVLVDFGLNVDD